MTGIDSAAAHTAPARATDPVVDIDGVTLRYSAKRKSTVALEDVSLRVGAGEFVTVLGPSGCGKSTLLKLAAGLIAPTMGDVRFGGRPVTGPQHDVGFVFQRAQLLEWRGVKRNILLQAEMRNMDKAHAERRARELIELTGLTGFEESLPHELSGGMQQRVSLCRALLHEPEVLLMDEPFGALDALTRERMNTLLNRVWVDTGATGILVTHSIPEAIFLGTRVIVMSPRPGRITHEFTVDLPDRREYAEVVTQPEFERLSRELRTLLGESAPDEAKGQR